MNLGRCIANLLRQYPEVWVPGIGVFKIIRTPAVFDREKAAFLPPVNHIELAVEGSGGFPITDYLQAQGQVDAAGAALMLEDAVQGLLDTLARKGKALLDGLGYLTAEGKKITFQPFEMHREVLKPAAEIRLPKVDDTMAMEAGTEEPEVIEEVPHKRHAAKWVIAASLLVLLTAVGWAWYYHPTWFDVGKVFRSAGQTVGKGGEVNGGEGLSGQPESAQTSVSDSIAVDSALMADTEADSASIAQTATDSVPNKLAVTYEIIVGSFATMAQAEKYVAEMKAKGYQLEAINSRMPGNRKKISWGSFATEEEAYRELARVQKTFEPSAWIAKVENH